MNRQQVLLEVHDLVTSFSAGFWGRREVRAVAGVSFSLAAGETLGIVGESGCGKSTLARSVLRLVAPSSGAIFFDGEDVRAANRGRLKCLRRQMQIVFQDPGGSLNSRMTAGASVEEPLRVHRVVDRRERVDRVAALLDSVGLAPEMMSRFPHELSGGQRQRVCIARAIALSPRLVVCDEAVSALDVSVQAQVLNLLSGLQKQLGMAYLFISHNLAVVEHISDWVAVMYLGRFVEFGRARDLYEKPRHPYTLALLAAVPHIGEQRRGGQESLPLAPLEYGQLTRGCAYQDRCPFVIDKCRAVAPTLEQCQGGSDGHLVACHVPVADAVTKNGCECPMAN